MSNEARRAAVAALIGLAGSTDYRDRADAGRSLAMAVNWSTPRGLYAPGKVKVVG